MPLNKSKSKQAFQENVGKEIAAGKPPKQAEAIAYSEKREAAKSSHHSSHSEKRSQHYHEVVVGRTTKGPTKMTQRRGQLDNREESDEKL
jgi:hypothetical protein